MSLTPAQLQKGWPTGWSSKCAITIPRQKISGYLPVSFESYIIRNWAGMGYLMTKEVCPVVLSHLGVLGVEPFYIKTVITVCNIGLSDPKAKVMVTFTACDERHKTKSVAIIRNLAYSPQDNRLFQVIGETNHSITITKTNVRRKMKNCIVRLVKQYLKNIAIQ